MAQQLVASGESVRLVGMLDTWQPGYMRQVRTKRFWPYRAWDRLRLVWLNTRKLTLRQTLRYTLGRLKSRFLRAMYGRLGGSNGVSLPGSMRRVRDINLMAGARYVVRPYPGKDLGWRAHALGGVDIVQLPGDHGQVLAEPNVSHLARELTAYLDRPYDENPHAAASRTDFDLSDLENGKHGGHLPTVVANASDEDGMYPVRDADAVRQPSLGRILVDHMTAIPEPWPAGRQRKPAREALE
jgi:hypothetical protein